MEAAAHHTGELIPLADAKDIRTREHEGSPRLGVGDGVDTADLRALLVGGDEVFFVLGFHVCCSVSGAGIFSRGLRRQGYYTSVEVVVGSTGRGVGGS